MNDIRISKTTTGNVGEHYVAAELERRNFTTSVVGNNCKDYDIIAINNETHKDVLIQVKASSNKNRWRVNKNNFDNYYNDLTHRIIRNISPSMITQLTQYYTEEAIYRFIGRSVRDYLISKINGTT